LPEVLREEVFPEVEALQLVHGLLLLLPFLACDIEGLVLNLDARNLFLDF